MKTPGLAQVAQAGDERVAGAGGGVRRVERPVAGAVVGVVVRRAGGEVDPRVGVPRGHPARTPYAAAARGSSRAPSRSTWASTRPPRRCPTPGSGPGGSSASSAGRRGWCRIRGPESEVATSLTSGSREATAPTLSTVGCFDPPRSRVTRTCQAATPAVEFDCQVSTLTSARSSPWPGTDVRRTCRSPEAQRPTTSQLESAAGAGAAAHGDLHEAVARRPRVPRGDQLGQPETGRAPRRDPGAEGRTVWPAYVRVPAGVAPIRSDPLRTTVPLSVPPRRAAVESQAT